MMNNLSCYYVNIEKNQKYFTYDENNFMNYKKYIIKTRRTQTPN